MRCFWAVCTATFLLQGAAFAADPMGEWRVANGNANIRIDNCDGALWGVISWEKEPGGVDAQNPNPAERKRPTLGMPILLAMKPTRPGLWQGEVYNAENGKTYDSKISLASADVLRIEGCVLGFLCGGENWSRVKPGDTAPTRTAATPAASRSAKPAPVLTACSSVAGGAGAAHKSGLK